MRGYKPDKKLPGTKDAVKLAGELNSFYARFDQADYTVARADVLAEVDVSGIFL